MDKVRWGILGDANIGRGRALPPLRRSDLCTMVALASRNQARAESAAAALGIPRAYGSYEQLLADPEVEVVYIPLPNHMHLEWTIRAAESGKHVLCEKPIGLTAADAKRLIEVRDRTGVLIQEAFMVRTHPQWLRVRELVRTGEIGTLRAMQSVFGNMNRDPKNIRNVAAFGGGALYDLGCYPITTSRFVFDAEPVRVLARMEHDPEFGTDRLDSVILDFPAGQSSFVCSTQMALYQRAMVFGSTARIEIEMPYAAPPDQPTRLLFDRGGQLAGIPPEVETIAPCNQYQIQAERFSQAVRGQAPQAIPLEDSWANMKVLDAVRRSAETEQWESIGP